MSILKKTKFFLWAWGLLLLSLQACGSEETEPASPIDFQFRLLDAAGNEKTTFQDGEEIYFNFQIINNSEENVTFFQSVGKDFFAVYKFVSDESGNNISKRFIGKPYKSIFCTYQYDITIPKKDKLVFEIPWIWNK